MVDSINLLIVDDCEDDREMYIRHLRSDDEFSYRFIEAETADEALLLYQANTIHGILLDFSLPGRDGTQVLADLKKLDNHIPAVMLTGQGNEKVAADAIKLGAQDYLTKSDVTAAALKRVVHNAIERVEMLRKIDLQQDDLSAFAGVLAHDLKAPINVIRGMNELIVEALNEQDYDSVSELTVRIERSTRRMSELIDTLRVYNKSSNNNRPLLDTSLEILLEDALINLELDIQKRGARITHDPLPNVMGDPPQIIQLMQNLIANGIKYSNAPTPEVHISAELVENAWRIGVKDNGIGIQEEDLQVIFQPFKRLHGYDEYRGSGLGLATCRKILDRHRCKIWCDSEAGKGTTFYFTLPVAAVAEKSLLVG
ncbi:sensor histidine kinase [Cohaesibacter celericrescens]|nr:hybrid sensor histidine kinase/response regulator [Cohaesibacter celericrescens]